MKSTFEVDHSPPTPCSRRLATLIGYVRDNLLLIVTCCTLSGIVFLAFVGNRLQTDVLRHTAVGIAGGMCYVVFVFASWWSKRDSDDLATVLRKLQESESSRIYLATLVNSTTDFVGISDIQGRVQYINRAGRLLVGLSASDDVSHLTIEELHPFEALQQLQTVALTHAAAAGCWNGESVILTRDGRTVAVWMVIVAHKNTAGEVESYSTMSRDITTLKDVGNVLNRVNVSSNLLMEKLRGSRAESLIKAADVISQHQGDLATFLANDERGRHFLRLLKELATILSGERDAQLEELRSLVENIGHVKDIINTQQSDAQLLLRLPLENAGSTKGQP